MKILDNLKKILSGIFGNAPEQNNDDAVTGRSDSVDETPQVPKRHVRIPVPRDLSLNLLDDDLADEPMPCVYGPPSWYNEKGGLDRCNPEVKEFVNEIKEIEARNRQRQELRSILQDSVDEPMAKVYGPAPKV